MNPDKDKFKFLTKVKNPRDIKNLSKNELLKICQEIRDYMIDFVSKTGGHLGAGLGVVELTVALHYVFDSPIDKIIWDIGHQSYPHKILTGRFEKMETIRQENGISGFCSIFENEHDIFGAGHSSTSISAGLGIAIARDLKNENFNVISVIGDSSMTAGMAYEAMNNAGSLGNKMIVILNDNDMSISPAVGALRNYLVKLISSRSYTEMRNFAKKVTIKMPKFIPKFLKRTESAVKDFTIGRNIFEDLGFYYIGPVDGHNLDELIDVLRRIRIINLSKPILLHVKTEKGKGYLPAKDSYDKLHGVNKFDITTGEQIKNSKKTYTDVFSDALCKLAEKDDKIIGITAAMLSGTGLDKFQSRFPERTFDVTIAEQHAVTFAGSLAISGFKPFCCIYSTFLQRAYDQLIHDICIQKLPVRFIIDRAGFVGADGATHCGAFDIAFLSVIPNIILMAPSNGKELIGMLKFMSKIDNLPSAIRFPRGEIPDSDIDFDEFSDIQIGKMNEIHSGNGNDIAIISYGHILEEVLKARDILIEKHSIDPKIIDARFAKPIDEEKLIKLSQKYKNIITIEEGSRGGFGSIVAEFIANLNADCKVYQMHMTDEFQSQNKIENMRKTSKIDADSIIEFTKKIKEN